MRSPSATLAMSLPPTCPTAPPAPSCPGPCGCQGTQWGCPHHQLSPLQPCHTRVRAAALQASPSRRFFRAGIKKLKCKRTLKAAVEEPDFLLFDFFFFSEGCCIELNMTNMPGMFALRAWESRERHCWHLISAVAPVFVQKQVPGAAPGAAAARAWSGMAAGT